MPKQYYIQTYGCQMNVHESEKIVGILDAQGYIPAADKTDADIMVFNTCCIRQTAESKIYGHLSALKKLKEQKPELLIIVCGCMTQQEGAAKKLKRACPYVDIVIGTHNLHKLSDYINNYYVSGGLVDVWESEGELSEDTPIYRSSGVNAWINIMYGCDNFCSYCIVPYVRGRERSRDFNTIVSEAQFLIESGYKEITLLGQNVNSYRGSGKTFADLITAISQINAKFRLKFMTSHPKDFSAELIKAMAKSVNVSKWIHLPIQAGSDRILKLMNRGYTQAEYLDKIALARSVIPDIGITSDIMVGFPTETEQDFSDTLKAVERVGYNSLFTFIYSQRSGTPANEMEQVKPDVKRERIRRLIELQNEISAQKAQKMVGGTVEVLVHEYKNNKCYGKSQNEMSVEFKSGKDLTAGFVNVKITSNKNSNLLGETV